ncbi:hypothetical protein BDZ91DRAFT_365638 [Kalaharituber pfeilii]|nr:hypothetical protein BDZ91DRAFT_365638 [Kalaharituber pfeilii]
MRTRPQSPFPHSNQESAKRSPITLQSPCPTKQPKLHLLVPRLASHCSSSLTRLHSHLPQHLDFTSKGLLLETPSLAATVDKDEAVMAVVVGFALAVVDAHKRFGVFEEEVPEVHGVFWRGCLEAGEGVERGATGAFGNGGGRRNRGLREGVGIVDGRGVAFGWGRIVGLVFGVVRIVVVGKVGGRNPEESE